MVSLARRGQGPARPFRARAGRDIRLVIDEIRRLVEAGILKSVSVGFQPIESRPREDKSGGVLFVKQSLVETSLVSVPSNPNALAVAKSLGISADTRALVFAERGAKPRATLARPKPPSATEAKIVKLEAEQARLIRCLCGKVELLAICRESSSATIAEYHPSEAEELANAIWRISSRRNTACARMPRCWAAYQERAVGSRTADRNAASASACQCCRKGAK